MWSEMAIAMRDTVGTAGVGLHKSRENSPILEPVINFTQLMSTKNCLYIAFTFRHYTRDESVSKELCE
jgi:hypothetical protein